MGASRAWPRAQSQPFAAVAGVALLAVMLCSGGMAMGCRNGQGTAAKLPKSSERKASPVKSTKPSKPVRSTPPVAPVSPPAEAPVVRIPTGGGEAVVRVELARTASERARGLMFRRSLPPDIGMLFLFPSDGDWSFYMRNTHIPLDIIFIDANARVVGVLPDMRPLDETPRRVGRPSRYVLEVNAGSVARWGLRVGDEVVLPGVAIRSGAAL